jgi:hypothetical protein
MRSVLEAAGSTGASVSVFYLFYLTNTVGLELL